MERVKASTTIAFIYDGRYYERIVEHLNIAGYPGGATLTSTKKMSVI